MTTLEQVPPGEDGDIKRIVELTNAQLKRRYTDKGTDVLRGVHTKGHGCVAATFTVEESLEDKYRVGVFAQPGRAYEAVIRFSNASVDLSPDSELEHTKAIKHGSRGMAVKLMGVAGSPLMPTDGPLTQDFLMVNQPVFAFANVEDYLALSDVLQKNNDDAKLFFTRIGDTNPDISRRAKATAGIVGQITSPISPPAFQPPPLSPLDNRYFSGSAFLFGEGRAMKFAAEPVSPKPGSPSDVSDRDYLRKALHERLTGAAAGDAVFKFQIQIRGADSLAGKLDPEIENASTLWKEEDHAFVTVATIRIPRQEVDTAELQARCERLVFSPWHGIAEHRPLGGINRLRRAVYEASAVARGASPGGCPAGRSPPASTG